MQNKNKKGFTLVELIVVIAIIGILAAVLIPTFSGAIDSANRGSVESTASSLKTAYLALTTDPDYGTDVSVVGTDVVVASFTSQELDQYANGESATGANIQLVANTTTEKLVGFVYSASGYYAFFNADSNDLTVTQGELTSAATLGTNYAFNDTTAEALRTAYLAEVSENGIDYKKNNSSYTAPFSANDVTGTMTTTGTLSLVASSSTGDANTDILGFIYLVANTADTDGYYFYYKNDGTFKAVTIAKGNPAATAASVVSAAFGSSASVIS